MTYVALASLALNAVIVLGFLNFTARSARAHARREDLLVNQLCSVAGRPWQAPPAVLTPLPDLVDDVDLVDDDEVGFGER